MKTSLDISEPLWREVKELAKQRGTTTKSLVEQALIKLLAETETSPPGYHMPDMSVPGGYTAEFQHATWEQLREEIYPVPAVFARPE